MAYYKYQDTLNSSKGMQPENQFISVIGVLRSMKKKELEEEENRKKKLKDEYINETWEFPFEELYAEIKDYKDITLISDEKLKDEIIDYFTLRMFGKKISKLKNPPIIYDVKHDKYFFTIYYSIKTTNQ